MPNRILRDGILTSELVNNLSPEGEVFYRRLMSVVDDYGRYFANPSILVSHCYPLKAGEITINHIESCLNENQKNKLIQLYQIDGKKYLQVLNFRQRQRTDSKFPEPPDNSQESASCQTDDGQLQALGEGGVGDEGGDVTQANACGDSASRISPCPHEEIIGKYHAMLPMCTKVKSWTAQRQANLRQRWREHPSLDEWEEFFRRVSASKFLTGQVSRGDRRPFVASLDWLVKPENFAKVLEGKYAE